MLKIIEWIDWLKKEQHFNTKEEQVLIENLRA